MLQKKITAAALIAFCAVVAGLLVVLSPHDQLLAQSESRMTKADVERMMTEISNRGRRGKDDQPGAVNLITPAKRKQAAALVRAGIRL